MSKKLKRIQETSRGGRRQVLIKNKSVRTVCERVSQETGYPFQWVFDELIEMFCDGYVFGLNTQDELFSRITEKLEE
jgi:hypothetical protein